MLTHHNNVFLRPAESFCRYSNMMLLLPQRTGITQMTTKACFSGKWEQWYHNHISAGIKHYVSSLFALGAIDLGLCETPSAATSFICFENSENFT